RKKVETLHDVSLVRLAALDGIKQAVLTNRYLFFTQIDSTDPEEMKQIEAAMKANSAGATERYKAYEATLADDTSKAEYATITDFRKRYIETRARVMALNQNGDKPGARALFEGELAPLLDAYVGAVQKLSGSIQAQTLAFAETIRAQTLFSQQLMIAASALTLVLAVLVSWLIIRSTNATLRRVASDLTAGSEELTSVAECLSTASQSLADGTSHQAASIQETSASLEQLSALGKQNKDRSLSASGSAERTRQAVDTGLGDLTAMTAALRDVGSTSHEMEMAMEAMRASSNDIGKIIKTIDEIAFQTNILALNAAVEAARAGEHGTGFAVVAEEVRALAQRSAEAAKSTSALIESTIQRSHAGAQVSEKVASTVGSLLDKSSLVEKRLREIANLVQDVNGLSNAVSLATAEQTSGIGQISTAVHDIDSVTQRNAATSEETAAAAEELSAQATTLRGNVMSLMALIDSRLARRAGAEAAGGIPLPVAAASGRPATLRGAGAGFRGADRPALGARHLS
ncbi:MAG TPA: methyl-accepting chemotaxis protein, partial [Candidatus Methylacidiphilales bacterium]